MFTAPPNIVSDPLSMTVEEGARASLACQFHAMAHPVTVVLWKKNGKVINEDGSHIKMNKADGTLVISEVELDDHGNYSCLVNTTGFKPVHSKPAIVLVKGKTHIHELLLSLLWEAGWCRQMADKRMDTFMGYTKIPLTTGELLRFIFSQMIVWYFGCVRGGYWTCHHLQF